MLHCMSNLLRNIYSTTWEHINGNDGNKLLFMFFS
jgi:hypothetical protein